MGQYYKILTENNTETLVWSMQNTKFNNTHDFNYYIGLKLMEHSYYGNELTDAVSTYIYKNPTRLYWVGDYSYDINKEVHEKVYSDDNNDFIHDIVPKFDYSSTWFVNHSQKVAIKLLEPSEIQPFSIYPISLLTAVGNGLGGGDYRGNAQHLVGKWAGDIVSLEDELPIGYLELPYPEFAE